MAIAPLPEATICLLGSTQALTTPTSLVKELIDNALDAKATSLEIIISPNTIDKIEVRDNGNGIPREDFNALGRRGYTSKLRTFDELKFIGGISLGFRGEALFSAAQLGKVSVTSKSEGETVATTAWLQPQGGVDSLISTSHPIGTTICVTEFFWSIPVRKQTCLKEASKTMGKIKELLRAYSLARPHIRFNLKVNKSGKSSWLYSPCRNNGIKETVSQVIGRDLASQCMEKSVIFSEIMCSRTKNDIELGTATSSDTSTDNNKFVLDMFLPKPTADTSKISHGQYISVDGRPMSNNKGTVKRIITIYKHYVKSCFFEFINRISNPFLQMNIKCPMESYDPNIEPAKDDVIFINEQILLESIENTFKEIYGECNSVEKTVNCSKKIIPDNFEILLSREMPPITSTILPLPVGESISRTYCVNNPNDHDKRSQEDVLPSRLEDVQSISPTKRIDMSIDYNENVETPIKSNTPSKNLAFTPESSKFCVSGKTLNPWVISKRDKSLKHSEISNKSSLPNVKSFSQNLLPSPQLSSDPTMIETEGDEVEERLIGSNRTTDSGRSNSISAQAIEDSSVQLISPRCSLSGRDIKTVNHDTEPGLFVSPNTSSSPSRRRCEFVSARQIRDLQQFPDIETCRPKRQKIVNKPSISPLKKNKKVQEDFHQTLLTSISPIARSETRENDEQSKEINSNLTWSMDYEHRKEEATKKFRDELRMSQKSRGSPHSNRYNAATLALDTNSCLDHLKDKKSISYPKVDTSLSDDDPRGYYIRRQKSFLSLVGKVGGPKISRAKSLRLPLERIPVEQQLHQHLMKLCTNIVQAKRMSEFLMPFDQYLQRGNQEIPLNCELASSDSNVKESLIQIVRNLIEKKLKRDQKFSDISINEIDFNFNQYATS
ncbi:DNA mismatch repair protein MutL [Erysiphe neolycopersici]|uniref:DNA mismatch repair protein MutL n=1 Tax=Erysiphe neolycopersici TaxID=212602 RepID=A0A420HRF4_9PEZI|nr:DNA mismatch repair protein MutL [Erysiphe neolycopersici]